MPWPCGTQIENQRTGKNALPVLEANELTLSLSLPNTGNICPPFNLACSSSRSHGGVVRKEKGKCQALRLVGESPTDPEASKRFNASRFAIHCGDATLRERLQGKACSPFCFLYPKGIGSSNALDENHLSLRQFSPGAVEI